MKQDFTVRQGALDGVKAFLSERSSRHQTVFFWRRRAGASDCSAPSSSLVINASLDCVGGRAALHVIDEGSQLWQYLSLAGIIEKHAWRHRRERLQHAHEPPGSYCASDDRLGQLRKAYAFNGRAEYGGSVIGDERSRDDGLDGPVAVDKGPGRQACRRRSSMRCGCCRRRR
jgi:hypothetical protein